MQIITPGHLTAYLRAICVQHPMVRTVITGEGSRGEGATLASTDYPQVRIETPASVLPRAESQKTLTTRLYVLAMVADATEADDDRILDEAYRIAENIIQVIDMHTDDTDIGISLVDDRVSIQPVISMGSDQLRGWMFDINLEVDKMLCVQDLPFDPETFILPQFIWELQIEDDQIVVTLADESIADQDTVKTWYWKEAIAQPASTAFAGDEISIAEDPAAAVRRIHVWLKLVRGGFEIYSYAQIDSDQAFGRSDSFIPHYPD